MPTEATHCVKEFWMSPSRSLPLKAAQGEELPEYNAALSTIYKRDKNVACAIEVIEMTSSEADLATSKQLSSAAVNKVL
jgi:hypothetical protein